jgi:acyl-CoA-binding protein
MSRTGEDCLHAVQSVQHLPVRPDNDTLLRLYALYKQATEGDIRTPPPGYSDSVGNAKHVARRELRGTSHGDAMQRCIDPVQTLSR